MNIKWLGHSSFLITSNKTNTKILTDPFPNTIGYKTYNDYADIVTISHHHFDHNCLDNIKGDYVVIHKVGELLAHNIKFTCFPSFHDEVKGAKRGNNSIIKFCIDGINICHLGDLGHMLSDSEIKDLGEINVLLIPVGGNYTIDNIQAFELCQKINSNIVIPMHYKTPDLNFELDDLENFLIKMGNYANLNTNELIIDNRASICEFKNKVIILDY